MKAGDEDMDDDPWNATIQGTTVCLPEECILCGDFTFACWRLLHGEAECTCGAVYQLRPTSQGTWDDVPRHKIDEDYLDACRAKVERDGDLDGFEEFYEQEWSE